MRYDICKLADAYMQCLASVGYFSNDMCFCITDDRAKGRMTWEDILLVAELMEEAADIEEISIENGYYRG